MQPAALPSRHRIGRCTGHPRVGAIAMPRARRGISVVELQHPPARWPFRRRAVPSHAADSAGEPCPQGAQSIRTDSRVEPCIAYLLISVESLGAVGPSSCTTPHSTMYLSVQSSLKSGMNIWKAPPGPKSVLFKAKPPATVRSLVVLNAVAAPLLG